ncbi:hypothetical protein R3P38DRAFT_3178436 [Favolaschia claudopus]|uniref:Uncharacterized protein n=1 Tax=Favolaschia claudopus TaxID=2862362 RepID=A0AAW0CUN1_9AGAR
MARSSPPPVLYEALASLYPTAPLPIPLFPLFLPSTGALSPACSPHQSLTSPHRGLDARDVRQSPLHRPSRVAPSADIKSRPKTQRKCDIFDPPSSNFTFTYPAIASSTLLAALGIAAFTTHAPLGCTTPTASWISTHRHV